MKKVLQGYLFNRLEKLGDKEYNHIGFEDDEQKFGDIMASFVPEIGTKKRARLTLEIIEE